MDTSVLITGDAPRIVGDLALNAVSLAELHFGVLAAEDPVRRGPRLARLVAIERRFERVPVDARSYGLLAAAVRIAGRQPRVRALDLMIAATAHALDAHLATRNAADLRGIEHLVAIDSVA